MSLRNLAGLLEASGLEVSRLHGDEPSLEEFRELVKSNLSREGDYLSGKRILHYRISAHDQFRDLREQVPIGAGLQKAG